MTDDELREYISGLKPGERVIETTRSMLWRRKGTIYLNDKKQECVLWDGPEKMGTSVTHGTRRLSEVEASE